MRFVQFPIPTGDREAVIAFLADSEFDYTLVEEVSDRDYEAVLFVPAETNDLEYLLDGLGEIGIQDQSFVAISDLETLISHRYEASDEETGVAREKTNNTQIAHEELLARAEEMSAISPHYVELIALSAVVATAGMLTDSAAVIVGSMVIAPLLGPAIGASVGRMIHEPSLFRDGLRAQVVGVVLAVISALAFSLAIRYTIGAGIDVSVLEEVTERTNPGILSLVVAIASGIAGALAFTAGTTAVLVGVMIAAALIPPAAAVGIGLAFGQPVLAASAAVLVLVNVLCINLTSMVVLWLRGYRPKRYREQRLARAAAIKQITVLVLAVLILSSFLVVTSIDATRNAQFETEVDDVIQNSGATVLSYSVSYETWYFSRTPASLNVVVTQDSPDVATEIQSDIRAQTGYNISVTVQKSDATTVEVDTEHRPSPLSVSI